MKKRLLSLALILVLTLICGVQIAADSAETQIACRHTVMNTTIEWREDVIPNLCYHVVYEHTLSVCANCGYTVRGEDRYVTEYYTHDYGEPIDGIKYCKICSNPEKKQ